jgi:hypothetical protein
MIQARRQQAASARMRAPKLTVLSGKTAEITFVFRSKDGILGMKPNTFWWSYNPELASYNFAKLNIAVELTIFPTMEVDGSASLSLNAKVLNFEAFVGYRGMRVVVSSRETLTIPLRFYQPVFSMREIHAEVNMFDKATVAMRQSTREEAEEVNETNRRRSPLFGKLFLSQTETTQNRSPRIFVTVRTISPILGIKDAIECPSTYRGKIGPFSQSYDRYDANFQMEFLSWGR